MSSAKSGARTMLMSVIISSTGPIGVGLSLIIGHSMTQVADFIRRSAELLAIILSYAIFLRTNRNGICDKRRKVVLERRVNSFAGAMMCVAGGFMVALSFMPEVSDKGNVIPGLCIAINGTITNTIFWRKYVRMNREEPNAILAVQGRLYRAKSFVDVCVAVALLSVIILPNSPVSTWLDFFGSLIVAGYLLRCGIRTIWEALRCVPEEE